MLAPLARRLAMRSVRDVQWAIAVFCFVLPAASCGEQTAAPMSQQASATEQPLLHAKRCPHTLTASGALVLAGDESTFGLRLLCSGTLIRPDVVLTAAHCFGDSKLFAQGHKQPEVYFTTVSSVQTASPHQVHETTGFVLHPGFAKSDIDLLFRKPRDAAEQAILERIDAVCGSDGGTWNLPSVAFDEGRRPMTQEMMTAERLWYECVSSIKDADVQKARGALMYDAPAYDIALVFLKRPIADVKPAPLPAPDSEVKLGFVYPVSGYGRYRQSERTVLGVKTGVKHCGQATFTAATDTELGYDAGPALACFGDSGGGAFADRTPGAAIIGVVSRCDVLPYSLRCRGEGILTKVAAFVPWIAQELQRHEAAHLSR